MDWQEKLRKEFPYLYRVRKYSLTQRKTTFIFECEQGWEDILRMTSILLMYEIKKEDKWWWFRPYLQMIQFAWNNLMFMQPRWMRQESIFGRYPRFTIYKYSGYCAMQVKEKYGLLRFYMDGSTIDMIKHIDAAETLSHTVCHMCGEPGKMRGASFSYVACDIHTKPQDLTLPESDKKP